MLSGGTKSGCGMKTYTPAEMRDLAYAAGQDAGNRSMWAAERPRWNADDWKAACEAFEKLYVEKTDAELRADLGLAAA